MRSIQKAEEPGCLAERRREAARVERETGKAPVGRDWDPRDCGDPIREALCREQHGLCAYCMRRIRPTGGAMKIEHFIPRACEPRSMYDWNNLLGVCKGELLGGPRGRELTCDTARESARLNVHPGSPSPPRPEQSFMFNRNRKGELEPKGSDAESDCRVLNLNCQGLIDNRRGVIESLRARLRSELGPDNNKARKARVVRRLLEVSRTPRDDELPEYARVAQEYLERQLRACGQ